MSEAQHTRLAPIVENIRQYPCPECGVYFASPTAVKQRCAAKHTKVSKDDHFDGASHCVDGMPQCRHCQKKLYNWESFKQHIIRNACGWKTGKADSARNPPPITPPQNAAHAPSLPDPTPNVEAGKPGEGVKSSSGATTPTTTGRLGPVKPALLDAEAQAALRLGIIQGYTRIAHQRSHLVQHCGFCGQWIAEAKRIKSHIRTVHHQLWERHSAGLQAVCQVALPKLVRHLPCFACGAIVDHPNRHVTQCPILHQVGLACLTSQEVHPPWQKSVDFAGAAPQSFPNQSG